MTQYNVIATVNIRGTLYDVCLPVGLGSCEPCVFDRKHPDRRHCGHPDWHDYTCPGRNHNQDGLFAWFQVSSAQEQDV